MGRITNVPGLTAHVPGTRNSQNPRQYRDVPGVPGVPGLCARARDSVHAHALAFIKYSPRVHTRNTRNTRNTPCATRLSAVPGTRNIKTYTRNMPKMTKPLRQAMSYVTSIIDDFRNNWPEAGIVESVKAGMAGQPVFHARENGHEIGTALPCCAERSVSMADIELKPFNATDAHSASRAKGK